LDFKVNYIYYAIIAATVAFLFINTDTTPVPTLATGSGFLLLLLIAGDQSWKAFKRCGRAAIVTSLKPDDGGHSTIHPDDISIAVSPSTGSTGLPNFVVFATGGFVHGGVEWQGEENFFVCPPEHVEQTGAALICRTKFRKVAFGDLPDYVQAELLKLKYFSIRMVKVKHNLWFGMTSKLDGTATTKFLSAESDFLDQTSVINQLKKLLRDSSEGSGGKTDKNQQPIILNLPDRR